MPPAPRGKKRPDNSVRNRFRTTKNDSDETTSECRACAAQVNSQIERMREHLEVCLVPKKPERKNTGDFSRSRPTKAPSVAVRNKFKVTKNDNDEKIAQCRACGAQVSGQIKQMSEHLKVCSERDKLKLPAQSRQRTRSEILRIKNKFIYFVNKENVQMTRCRACRAEMRLSYDDMEKHFDSCARGTDVCRRTKGKVREIRRRFNCFTNQDHKTMSRCKACGVEMRCQLDDQESHLKQCPRGDRALRGIESHNAAIRNKFKYSLSEASERTATCRACGVAVGTQLYNIEKHLQDCIETHIKNEKSARPTRPNKDGVGRSHPIMNEIRNRFEKVDFGRVRRRPGGKVFSCCACRHCGVQLKVSIVRQGNHLKACRQLPEEFEYLRNALFDCPICLRFGIPQSLYKDHLELCNLKHCRWCWEDVALEDWKLHLEICPAKVWECWKCGKKLAPPEKAEHQVTCQLTQCHVCKTEGIEDLHKHQEECATPRKSRRLHFNLTVIL